MSNKNVTSMCMMVKSTKDDLRLSNQDDSSQVEMMQDNDLKNSKSKDKGSKSRSQSMNEQSHYKQDKTITRQSINVKRHIFNVIGDTEKFEEENLTWGRFWKHSKLEGDDLLTGSHDSNLYTISIFEMAASSPVCLMSRATSTKSWLWHRRRKLSHLNFGTINQLTSKDLVDGLLKFKYNKDHLCSACEQGKSKKASLPPKLVPSTESKLELLHMDLCGPMCDNYALSRIVKPLVLTSSSLCAI
ncbi:retrovirus-related pol polyprotein from transposon TNT 1-94 [Tanacetum coccineum]|uniref:Retrovirus-related pol polyprotein from transposon TNT 1-94 n=1 Tax=Tanacetum coccineum TaxID=301880 RepID=A0ABQ5CIR1_9ASTR